MTLRTIVATLVTLAPISAFAANPPLIFMPPNDLHKQDNIEALSNITEIEFNAIIDGIINAYKPLAAANGGTLKSNNAWSDSTVNASAQRQGKMWLINMYGGMARRPEMTKDGFAMIVCHELGHHLAGFPFVGGLAGLIQGWAADEGQSDYFASQSCLRKVWKNDLEVNARARTTADAFARERCDEAWQGSADRDLCYRISDASKSLGNLLAQLKKQEEPQFDTPDPAVVRRTNHSHPDAQCRLDTYLAGGLCAVEFNETVIPGLKAFGGRGSLAAEQEAARSSCMGSAAFARALRPQCWFFPRVN